MFSRHTYLVVGLMVAGGAPYLSSQPGVQDRISSFMPGQSEELGEQETVFRLASANEDSNVAPSKNPFNATGSASSPATSSSASASTTTTPATTVSTGASTSSPADTRTVTSSLNLAKPQHAPVDGSKPILFDEVFRLDVNSAWLMARWPRVTTGLAEIGLHGYRVSLLTGKREDDLAGALTYYYDKEQVIQKMTFRGVTGDPRRLVLFATRQYALEKETVDDPALQVYRTKGLGQRGSELIVRPAQVIRADAPRERFEVELTVRR